MRPVVKGHAGPVFDPYQEAQEVLKERLGEYCSYCERWVTTAIEVEHKRPKTPYPGESTLWVNFLLSCKNCNSGKGATQLELLDYIWPDTDNSFLAFCYDNTGRVSVAQGLADGVRLKAEGSLQLFGLDRHPTATNRRKKPSSKDKRWLHRCQAWQKAEKFKQSLATQNTPEQRELILTMALERGMFSIWMNVFNNDSVMKCALINRFPSTSMTSCFDAIGNPVPRPGGQL